MVVDQEHARSGLHGPMSGIQMSSNWLVHGARRVSGGSLRRAAQSPRVFKVNFCEAVDVVRLFLEFCSVGLVHGF